MAKTIRIGHASLSEKGSIIGDPGDSTGKEVTIVENYDITTKGFHTLLRPKDIYPNLGLLSAKACEKGCKNNNIGYSQDDGSKTYKDRLTLYNEAKKVNFDLSKITTKCNTDCSAYMSVCAIAGGAKNISPSNNTRSMADNFVKSGYYEKYTPNTDPKFFNCSDYLRPGDILIKSGHTIMVLGNENLTDVVTFNYFAIKIVSSILNISNKSANINTSLYKINNREETKLTEKEILNKYNWVYELTNLKNSVAASYKINNYASNFQIKVDNLDQNTSYLLVVKAKEKKSDLEFKSANVIFTTLSEQPNTIRNFKFKYNKSYSFDNEYNISFAAPLGFNSIKATKGYRVCLIVNGNIVGYNDNLINSSGSTIDTTITLKDITQSIKINNDDVVQIGILPWTKEVLDNVYLVCSESIKLLSALDIIFKIFIRIKDVFKNVILYNYLKG